MKRILTASLFLLTSLIACGGSQDAASRDSGARTLWPYMGGVNGESKWGYMDQTGKVVVPPQYLAAGNFSDGRGLVWGTGKTCTCWGYVDETGKMVIEPRFLGDEAMLYSDHGNNQFSEGLAVATDYATRKQEVIDKDGKTVFTVPDGQFLYGKYSEGLIPFNTTGGVMNYGYLDRAGKVVVEPVYVSAASFQEGLAAVRSYKYGYIDKTGKMVIRDEFDYAGDFSEGLAPVTKDGKSYYIDKTGAAVITPAENLNLGKFTDGVAFVRTKDPLAYGDAAKPYFIDKTGKKVIPPLQGNQLYYSSVGGFSEGISWYGSAAIDKTGKVIFDLVDLRLPIEAGRSTIHPFKSGIAQIIMGRSVILYVDKSGKQVLPKT